MVLLTVLHSNCAEAGCQYPYLRRFYSSSSKSGSCTGGVPVVLMMAVFFLRFVPRAMLVQIRSKRQSSPCLTGVTDTGGQTCRRYRSRVPNGDREHSPGMSEAIPWDMIQPFLLHPKVGARAVGLSHGDLLHDNAGRRIAPSLAPASGC